MVPFKRFTLKHNICNNGKHDETNTFLYHFQLNERKRTAVVLKADAIGWHLTTIFKEGYAPRESYNTDEWPMA